MPKLEPETEQILDAIRNENWNAVAAALSALHPADVADIIERAPRDAVEKLFSLLNDELKPDVLSELETIAESDIIDSLTNAELSEIVEDMDPDDAADIIGDLTEERSSEVLKLMHEDESKDVRRLLKYEEDTAGGIMTTDVVTMTGDHSVAEAIDAIVHKDEDEPFIFAYITDKNGKLIGYTDIWELLREKNRNRPLKEVCHTDFIAVNVNEDQEDVAHILSQYDLSAVPVVDDAGRIVGRITVDDIIDVIEDEASEDIFRLAGSDDIELESNSPIKSCMARLPWIMITLFGGFLTSLILNQFHERIAGVIILGAFVPAVLAMGGNAAIQASTLVVRTIALRELKGRKITALLIREVVVGAIMGSICGLMIGTWVFLMMQHHPDPHHSAIQLASVVGMSLFTSMSFAAVFGSSVPLALNRLGVDPAVASGPFVTIANDLSALLIYFGVTVTMLNLI